MGIASYIREIGRGRDGARSLDRAEAHDLMSQVLDGRVTDLRFPEKSTSAGGPVVLGVVGSVALLSITSGEGGCGGGEYETLVSHDLATGASHPLIGPLAGTGALYGSPVVLGAAA